MALVTRTFKLELSPDMTPGCQRAVITAKQGDIGRPYEASLFWDGEPWSADGYDVSLRGRKTDGTVFEYHTPTIDENKVSFVTAEQMTVLSGPVECELAFSNGGIAIATANFVLIVEASPYDPDAISESDVPSLTELINEAVEEAVADIKGEKGDQGPQGPKGDKGDPGEPGQDGADGADGVPGKDGEDGADGEPGPPNVLTIGTVESGATAAATITGTSPAQVLNLVLPQGPQGIQGIQGPKGETGATGPQGPAGTNGTNGTDGTDGTNGTDGTTFTPAVSSAGVISWTNDGGKTNPASVDLVSAVISALPSAVGVSF